MPTQEANQTIGAMQGLLAPLAASNPYLAAGMAVFDVGWNLYNAFSSQAAKRKAQTRLKEALRLEQARWDREVGPVQRAYQNYLQGTETRNQSVARERSLFNAAEPAMRVAAPAISANAKAAQETLSTSFAARGLGASGVAAGAATDLEKSRLSTLGALRAQTLTAAQEAWARERQGYLQSAGPRPSMSSVQKSIFESYPADNEVDMSGLVSSLLTLAQKKTPNQQQSGGWPLRQQVDPDGLGDWLGMDPSLA